MTTDFQGGKLLLLLALSLALGGCRTRLATPESPIDLPSRFTLTGEADVPERWWLALGDVELNALIERALSGNFTLLAAWERVRQAEAQLSAAGAGMWPSLDARAENEFSWTRELVTTVDEDGDMHTDYEVNDARERTIGLAAEYEIDIWGRVRSLRRAEALELKATEEDLQAAAISLSAQVASVWYELREQAGQLELLDEQIRTSEATLKLIEARFRLGQVGASDVLQQRQFVEARREERARVTARIPALEIALALLVGEAPYGQGYAAAGSLIELPPLPTSGLPSELVARRPDVRSAYLAFQAADQRTAAAVADRYPRLSLTAGFTTSNEDWRALFDNWLATVAANVVAPIVDGGSRRAEVRRNRALTAERFNLYGQSILEALGEVEEALIRERRQEEVEASIGRQLELARQVEGRIRAQYLGGRETFLRVLDAEQSVQELERELLTARRERIGFRIGLYRALAGGWSPDAAEDRGEWATETTRGEEPSPPSVKEHLS